MYVKNRQQWEELDMAKALQNKTMDYTKAVKTFREPRTTLCRRFKNENHKINHRVNNEKGMTGRK